MSTEELISKYNSIIRHYNIYDGTNIFVDLELQMEYDRF